jgi:hypothetical protein
MQCGGVDARKEAIEVTAVGKDAGLLELRGRFRVETADLKSASWRSQSADE